MAVEIIFACDVCGRKKEATNHWWTVVSTDKSPVVEVLSGIYRDAGVGTKHACGEQHAHQLISDGMAKLQQGKQ